MSSCVIYHNVPGNDIQDMDRERVEMMVEIYESADNTRAQTESNTNRQQPLQYTGRNFARIRRYRSVLVCLVLLCVLLMTAVIVLCVQFQINNKNITQERDELRANYNNITKLYEQLRTHIYDGWIYYQSSFYFISSELDNWNLSRRYCRERGADLIIINNKEEQDFIDTNFGKDRIWIGLTDSDVEGRWKWVDNSTLTYSFWRSGEPNGGTKENCVESFSSGWNDNSCFTILKWICEKNMFLC